MEDSKNKKTSKKITKKPVKKAERSFGMAMDLDDQQLTSAPPPTSAIQEDDDDFIVCKGKTKLTKQPSEISDIKQPKIQEKKQPTQNKVVQKVMEPTTQQEFDEKQTTQQRNEKILKYQQPAPKEEQVQQKIPDPVSEYKTQVIAKVQISETAKSVQKIRQQPIAVKPIKPKQQEEDVSADEMESQPLKISKNEGKKKTKKTGSLKKVTKKEQKLSIINTPSDEEQNVEQKQTPGSQRSIQQTLPPQLEQKYQQAVQIELEPPIMEKQKQEIEVVEVQPAEQIYEINESTDIKIQEEQNIDVEIEVEDIEQYKEQYTAPEVKQTKERGVKIENIQTDQRIQPPISVEPIKVEPPHQQQLRELSHKEPDQQVPKEQNQLSKSQEEQQSPVFSKTKAAPKKKPGNKQKAKKSKPNSTTIKLSGHEMDWQEGQFKNQVQQQVANEQQQQSSPKQVSHNQLPKQNLIEEPEPVIKTEQQKQRLIHQEEVPVEVQPIQLQPQPEQIITQPQQQKQLPIHRQQQIPIPQQVVKSKQPEVIQQFEDFAQNKISINKMEKPKKTSKTTKTKKPTTKSTSKIVADDLDDMLEAKQQKVELPVKQQKIIEEAVQEAQASIQKQIIDQVPVDTQNQQQIKEQSPKYLQKQAEIPQVEEKLAKKQSIKTESIEENKSSAINLQSSDFIHQQSIEDDQPKVQMKFSNPKKKKTTKPTKETKTTKLKISKSQEQDILEEDVVIQPIPEKKISENQVPLPKQQPAAPTPKQEIQQVLPVEQLQSKKILQKSPEIKISQQNREEKQQQKNEAEIKLTQSHSNKDPVSNEVVQTKNEGLKITKNVVPKKKEKKEKQAPKKLNLNVTDDFEANFQQVEAPKSPEKPKIVDKIEEKLYEEKSQNISLSQVKEDQNVITQPLKDSFDNKQINHEVQAQNQEPKPLQKEDEQIKPQQELSNNEQQQQKFEDFVDKQEQKKPIQVPPQIINEQEVLQEQNTKFTIKNKQPKQKSKAAKPKEKKKLEEAKPKKSQKLKILNEDQFDNQANNYEEGVKKPIEQPIEKKQVSSKQPQKFEPFSAVKKEEESREIHLPKIPTLATQSKKLPEKSQNNTKTTKLAEKKVPPPEQPIRKKLVDELVSIVTLSNKKHLTSMKERLLMMQEDIRSSLYQRQQKQKIKEAHDVHYDHIIAENLQLKGRLGSGNIGN